MTPTLARKTRRAFFFVLFSPVVLGIIVALELSAYQRSVAWVEHTNQVISTMHFALLAITRAESAQRGFLLTQEDNYQHWFSKAHEDSDRLFATMKTLTIDNPEQHRRAVEIERLVAKRFLRMEAVMQLGRIRPLSPANIRDQLREGKTTMEELWYAAHKFTQAETSLLRSRTQTERATAIGVASSFAVCILINLGLLFWAYRTIIEYATARELAAEQILSLNAELEQRVAERTAELELTNTKLMRSNEDLTKFAYIASHDLQEPLRTIGSYVGLLGLRYQGQLDEQADKYIKFVVDGAKRMQNLVQDLLIYSRVGTKSLRLAPVNLESVLRNVRESLALLILEQHVSIASTPLPSLIGDESKLTQLFMNLVSNAIKFRKTSETPRIAIEASRSGDDWVFAVSDNGIGFDQLYAERIFAIFQRLHGVGAYPGTGMGLAICKRIVEQHGGKIWASSTPDQGSTFTFTIPAEIPVPEAKNGEQASHGRMKTEALEK